MHIVDDGSADDTWLVVVSAFALTQDFQCADQNQNPKVQTPAGRPLC
jgi:hypothetical protein